MGTLDHEWSGQHPLASTIVYNCIFCTLGFLVSPKVNYSHNITVQTTLCEVCRASLQAAIDLFNGLFIL